MAVWWCEVFFELETFADAACLIGEDGTSQSYAEVAERCDSLARHFPACKPLVLILCNNDAESLIAYLATLRAGGTAMLLSQHLEPSLLEAILASYQPHCLFSSSGLPEGLEGEAIKLSAEQGYMQCMHSRGLALFPDLAVMLSTSGSTGSPKFVRLSKNNIESNARSIASYLKLDAQERSITVLPMPYSYGLSVINSHLIVGARILLTARTIMEKEFWRFCSEAQATSLAGVPYTYEMLKRLRFERRELPALRTMTQAGGKLSESLTADFAELANATGRRFVVMYGATEATARMSYVPADRILSKCGSIGVAIPGGELSLADADENGEGELVYRGPNVMLGYAQELADLAKGDEMKGELRTGDLGRCDEDGYFYITGRLKRMIKMFGNRISLEEIDNLLSKLGIEGVSGGVDNHLQVMVTQESKVDSVKQALLDTFHFDHRSITVFYRPEILRSESGKIQYGKIFSEAANA